MRLILVRHGETAHNREGIVQGRRDIPLNATGRRQAEALADDLCDSGVAAIYASPLLRARETAKIIAERTGADLIEAAGLIEMDVGDMDGLALPEIRERYGEFLKTWRADETATMPLPGGENLTNVQTRAWNAVERMLVRHQSELVVAVSHQFTIQTILCRVMGVPLMNFERISLSPASKTLVEIGLSSNRVLYLNDRCHQPPELD